MHYEQSHGYDQYPIFMACTGAAVISVYILNPGKLPGRFSYKWPGYEASQSVELPKNHWLVISFRTLSGECNTQ